MEYLVPAYDENRNIVGNRFVEYEECVKVLIEEIEQSPDAHGLNAEDKRIIAESQIQSMYVEFEGRMVLKGMPESIAIERGMEHLSTLGEHRVTVIGPGGVQQL